MGVGRGTSNSCMDRVMRAPEQRSRCYTKLHGGMSSKGMFLLIASSTGMIRLSLQSRVATTWNGGVSDTEIAAADMSWSAGSDAGSRV